MSAPRRFAELRADEVATRLSSGSVLLVPLGAVEQHGPHLPLATDVIIAESVCDAAVARAGDELDLWVLPTLTVTKSDEHAWSAGTLWLSADTMLDVLRDLGASIATTPARRLVFVNAHGGNTALLAVVCRELRRRHDLLTFVHQPGTLPLPGAATEDGDTELGMGIHAGRDETSLLLHLRPDLVDMTRAAANVPDHLAGNEHVRFGGSTSFGWLSSDFGDGVIGDPTGADAEHGRALFESSVDALVAALGEVARYDAPPAPGVH